MSDLFTLLAPLIDAKVQQYQNDPESIRISTKEDSSLVTSFDILLSNTIKDFFKEKLPNHTFFSEEDYDELIFPAVIVDPLDGTRGFVEKSYESCVSIAIMNSPQIDDPKNEAWIYDLFKKEPKFPENSLLVSRSEWNKGLHNQKPTGEIDLPLFPFGSIAFKLKLISENNGCAVVSRQPKNIWDIAAGTILAHRAGLSFYENGHRTDSLDKVLFQSDLVWGPESILKEKNYFKL